MCVRRGDTFSAQFEKALTVEIDIHRCARAMAALDHNVARSQTGNGLSGGTHVL